MTHRVWTSVDEIRTANEEAGGSWFSPAAMQFFASRVESDVIAGRYFVTSERNFDNSARLFSIREANDDASVSTVEWQTFDSRADAVAAAEALGRSSSWHVAITGNPVDGFQYFGPFDGYDAAITYAGDTASADWWIAPLGGTS